MLTHFSQRHLGSPPNKPVTDTGQVKGPQTTRNWTKQRFLLMYPKAKATALEVDELNRITLKTFCTTRKESRE